MSAYGTSRSPPGPPPWRVAQKPTTDADQELRDDDLDVTGAPLHYRGAVADDGTGLVFQQRGEHAHATGQSGAVQTKSDIIKRQ